MKKIRDLSSVIYLTFVVAGTFTVASQSLNDWIQHYEVLTYDKHLLNSKHHRSRRSLNDEVNHEFQAFGRFFNMTMWPDIQTLSKNVVIETSKGNLQSHGGQNIYQGRLVDDPGSYIHGSIVDGRFGGKIYTSSGNFYVERAEYYFDGPQEFHSVIYKEEDVAQHSSNGHNRLRNAENMDQLHKDSISINEQKYKRFKRSSDQTTCSLYLHSDTHIWDRMTKYYSFTDAQAEAEIIALFALYVSELNNIFQSTVFQAESESYSGISFVIHSIKMNESTSSCPDGSETMDNPFCRRVGLDDRGMEQILDDFSAYNYDDFCLAYLFTYRDFHEAATGTSHLAYPERESGGICERYKTYLQGGEIQVWRSRNTGILTLKQYGDQVPNQISILNFAQEVGRSFGARYDSSECVPNEESGNYIMFSGATTGELPNNYKFSVCSNSDISEVLDAVTNEKYGKVNCFISDTGPFCGNRVVENGEQCDCGFEEECTDQCCSGRGSPSECLLANTAMCSPSQGTCCANTCTLISSESTTVCQPETECTKTSYCDGANAACPIPAQKQNYTVCNEKTQVCKSGECSGSICDKINWESCFYTEEGSEWNRRKLCYLACRNPNTGECILSNDAHTIRKEENKQFNDLLSGIKMESIKMTPGSPCNDYRGECNDDYECMKVADIINDEETDPPPPTPEPTTPPPTTEKQDPGKVDSAASTSFIGIHYFICQCVLFIAALLVTHGY